jgi:hypothetical protein
MDGVREAFDHLPELVVRGGKGGAKRVWSPAKPSLVGWVERVISSRSNAAWSTRPATRRSTGRNDVPSRGSTYSTPSR